MAKAPTRVPANAAPHHPLLPLLSQLGWRLLPSDFPLGEALFTTRLIEMLQTHRFEYKGSWYPLSPGGIDQVVRELTQLHLADGLLAANERIYTQLLQGITVTEFMPDGKSHQPTVPLVAWTKPEVNHWDMACHPPAAEGACCEITGFVNGIPLALIQAAQPGSSDERTQLREAIRRHQLGQRPQEHPSAYAYAQLLVAASAGSLRYGTTLTPSTHWMVWQEEPPHPAGSSHPVGQLLAPQRLLALLRGHILFGTPAGKIIARPHQFFATQAALQGLLQAPPGPQPLCGTVWHAPQAGKGLGMALLARNILLEEALADCKLIFLTQRAGLSETLAHFHLHHPPATTLPPGARSRARGAVRSADIAQQLASEPWVVSSPRKLSAAAKELSQQPHRLVVLTDRLTRQSPADLVQRIRQDLPQAAVVAYTDALSAQAPALGRLGRLLHVHEANDARFDEPSDSESAPSARLLQVREAEVPYTLEPRRSAANDPTRAAWRARVVPGRLPDAAACLLLIQHMVGEAAYSAFDPPHQRRIQAHAETLAAAAYAAATEHSLHAHNRAAALRQAVLPLLFAELGLQMAKRVADQLIEDVQAYCAA